MNGETHIRARALSGPPRARPQGRVFLVGAGPGDPDLITVKGLRVLQRADVVAYDRLIPRELLETTRTDAERIYVGKTPDGPSITQEAINELIVARARGGKTVVRLKGGDPFVFGRGGEEALALASAAVQFEIVPGVSSAVAVPAYAGIPVTHRKIASSFAAVTAHHCSDGVDSDWAALAKIDTLVLLMGAASIRSAAGRLILAGRHPEQPAAAIENGTTPTQRVVTGTLRSISDIMERERISSPATVVAGEVVSLREHIAWYREHVESAATGE